MCCGKHNAQLDIKKDEKYFIELQISLQSLETQKMCSRYSNKKWNYCNYSKRKRLQKFEENRNTEEIVTYKRKN